MRFMNVDQLEIINKPAIAQKIQASVELMKLRLASLVVFSAVLGYLIAPSEYSILVTLKQDWLQLILLSFGGVFVTGSSNGFNQVWEKSRDKKMTRTKERPMPSNRLTVFEGVLFSALSGAAGLFALYLINPISAILGLLAMVLYVLVYTPLKPITPLSVFVGAFPGSVPPMLGYVAATGHFGLEPGMLFLTQFFWQFPHFWSIAWRLHDDYILGGFWMLPSKGGRDKSSAYQIMLYSAFMIPVGMLPWVVNMTGVLSAVVAMVFGIIMLIPAIKLFKTLDEKYAKKIMFYSFAYLPLMLIIYLIDKV